MIRDLTIMYIFEWTIVANFPLYIGNAEIVLKNKKYISDVIQAEKDDDKEYKTGGLNRNHQVGKFVEEETDNDISDGRNSNGIVGLVNVKKRTNIENNEEGERVFKRFDM